MAASKRVTNAKSGKFHQLVHKRGQVEVEKKEKSSVNSIMLGFFLFVVVGSALLQIIRTATTGPGLF
ncbi:hypothetical protein MNEG_8517 [Monoraphidium neglectum]|uniref:Stress-associated endoplasmic reticulum protein 2 n=1 Tax=Monoraphidium neglectum TaxID=145388 RepID=A0A0D2MZ66_9CHLO|nr:hypothetical protein MNEG_8517 [Monoraphidium neglectum]KIY99440.1 hypothetical protein MNEG_8517 [Monoraphidium neglectum]|eukprot:XP_013898460.1 hypothetical protein MNEG_8517 [Monoraphidium neglectum]